MPSDTQPESLDAPDTDIGIDDSTVTIEGREHTILSAVICSDIRSTTDAIELLKREFPIGAELKWSGHDDLDPQRKKMLGRKIISILAQQRAILAICEGLDRKQAADHLLTALSSFLQNLTGSVTIHFDEEILSMPSLFEFCGENTRSNLKITGAVVRSEASIPVQLADIFSGYSKLAIDMVEGRPIPSFKLGEYGNISMSDYLHFALRYSVIGDVPGAFDNEDEMLVAMESGLYPIKYSAGKGLLIHSSISTEIQSKIISTLGTHWLGCIH